MDNDEKKLAAASAHDAQCNLVDDADADDRCVEMCGGSDDGCFDPCCEVVCCCG